MGEPLDGLAQQCRELISRSGDNVPSMVKLAASGTREALDRLSAAWAEAEMLLGLLARGYGAEIVLPRNVDPLRDFELIVWPDPFNASPFYGLLLLAGFTFSIYRGDGKAEYEPLEIVFLRSRGTYRPAFAYGRVHYDLCEYNLEDIRRLRIAYLFHGHTPYIEGVGYIRLRCPKVKRSSVHTGRKYWDRIWLGAATAFLRLTGSQRLSLSKMIELGLVKVMKCPVNFRKNPFQGPLFRGPS